MCLDPEDLMSTHADDVSATDTTSAAGDTASYTSEQSGIETRPRRKIVVRRSKSITRPSKMHTSESMPKVSCTFKDGCMAQW